ncbi:Chromosome transmission fidelity protein 18 [Cladobotryum mycophilum]|uniref:Chromosome transmission fidelity protein 18 n=1 Tax=Cladobotryum mycophilum TaxID=491253 RepID=A0ABR0T1E1_9HYPO
MLSASSPITFPSDPASPVKRPRPLDLQHPKPKPRAAGPFVDDSDSEEEDTTRNVPTPSKRRRIEASGDNEEPGSPSRVQDGTQIQIPHRGTPLITTTVVEEEEGERSTLLNSMTKTTYKLTTCAGREITIKQRKETANQSYESMVAARSKTKEGRAKRDYYGVDIHNLMNAASSEIAEKRQKQQPETIPDAPVPSVEAPNLTGKKHKKTMLWTEKYRAKNFMDLCGDDGTNRLVLRWLKKWDPLVFPGSAKSKPVRRHGMQSQEGEEEKPHRKILMLTGPPGLGKTTLAHVCAKQAGYEVIEVNASDDRSRDVVKNRIRTSLGTESVKNVSNRKDADGAQKAAKPACVIVDEVDGVTAGAGASGEGGFVKALIDLVLTDQKNSSWAADSENSRKKKKGDDFRLMRPLILICNDVYHPSLRPLRQSNLAEIIHVGRPMLDAVVGRLKAVFEKEGIPCDKDAARKLCEAAWGMASGSDAKRGRESTVQGDLRGVMVVGEWVASRFRVSNLSANQRLTREWIERNILSEMASGAAGARGLGRGSVKDIISRLFQEGGGFPKQAMNLSTSKTAHEQPKTELGFGEHQKKYAMECLRQMVDSSGEIGYIVTEIFAEYPNREFNDDHYLSKPNKAYDWLYFHDACQSRLYSSQEWELAPYLSQPVLACHDLFASPIKHFANAMNGFSNRRGFGAEAEEDQTPPMPFSGPRADYQAHEAEKLTRTQLQALQNQLSPTMMRLFRSAEDVATEFLPYLVRMVSPDVKPVVVGGSQGTTASVRKESERAMVKRASEVLAEVGIALQKGKIEGETLSSRGPQYVYRMEPDIDALSTFETGSSLLSSQAPTRYAVRQVLDQELTRTIALRESAARQARFKSGHKVGEEPPPEVVALPEIKKNSSTWKMKL